MDLTELPRLEGAQPLLSGLGLPEGPRWRDDRLWFSDLYKRRVMTVDLSGCAHVVAEFDDRPSGLGFLPDGTPIVVLMRTRRVMRILEGGAELHADLSNMPGDHLNDMIVDETGRAYVGVRRAPATHADPSIATELPDAVDAIVMVDVDGSVEVVAEDLITPNGLAITGDGERLVVAETRGRRITSFSISRPDGRLSDRSLIASTGDALPDGLCLDAEGGVWFGAPNRHACVHITSSGTPNLMVDCKEKQVMACTRGGRGRKLLFLMTAVATWDGHARGEADGSIYYLEVAGPEGWGRP